MARQLLPIRFLSTAAIFRASHSSSFSRFVAHLKLNDFSCSSRPCRLVHRREYTGGRTFSSRPARSGDSERGKLRMGSVSGQNKSLIEDEAELSDWVSDIRKDSFHKKVSSEDESSARGRGSGSRDRYGDSLRSRGGERSFRPAVRGGPSSGRIRGGGLGGYSSRGRRGVGSDESGDERGDDFSRRMSNGRGNRPGDSYESRRGSGTNARGASTFSKRGGGDYGRVGRGRGGIGDYGNGGRFGQSRRDEGDYAVGGRSGQSKRGRGDYQSSDRLGQSKRAAPVLSKNDDDDDEEDDDDDFLSDEDKRPGNRPGSTSDSRKRLGGAGRGISALSKRVERDNGIGERMGQARRIGGDYNIGGRIGQSRRGGGDYEADGRLGQGKRLGGDSQIGERPSPSKRTALLASNKDDDDDDSDDDDVDEDDDVDDDDDEDEEDSGGPSGFGSDFFGDKEALNDRVAEGASEKGSSVVSTDGDVLKAIPQTSTPRSESYLSQTRFDQFPLSPLSLKGVKAAGYERMTEVQEATLPVILKGKDVLAKARTGTGKTVAFLLPAIEVVVKLPPLDRDNKRPPIHVLVICPTRELADQAAAEASKLLKYHASIGVQVVIGGTRLALEQKRMQTNPCQLLVATPGRLRDHMENTPGFVSRLSGVKVLVLDEADRLLDMGFRKDIEKIIAELPKQRQTLLFSATVPDQVRQMCYIAMKRDSEFISTVEEGSEETHSQVSQTHLIAPLEKQFSLLYRILTDHIAEDVDYKVILFCTTAMVTKLVADLLAELHLNVREMHSRKPQSYRTRVAKEFKESKGLILVTSDVSARGVDYPDVTLVIQVGVPADREQYIHRLGRTGRKGKEGKGVLLLAPWEDFFLQSIRDLPITNAEVPIVDLDTRKKVERALAHVEMKNKESAYQAWLGYYKSIAHIGREKSKLVLLANEFSRSMGLDNPPAIAMLTLRKMGLNNVPGLRSK